MLTCAEELGLNLSVPPYFVCIQAAKVLVKQRICIGSSESSLLADVIYNVNTINIERWPTK